MSRMTIRNSDGSVSQPTDLKWDAALRKLADYEDAEENGELRKTPKGMWLYRKSDAVRSKSVSGETVPVWEKWVCFNCGAELDSAHKEFCSCCGAQMIGKEPRS